MENKEIHVHKFTDIVVPPTCKEQGYTLHKCACGYEHKDNFEPIGKHSFQVVEEIAPTCNENGKMVLRCTTCGEVVEHVIPLTGHQWGQWSVQKFATCTEDGVQVRGCTRCGYTEESVIKATGHQLTSPQKSKTEKGITEYFCKNCGQIIKKETGKKRKKIIISIISILLAVAILFALIFAVIVPLIKYNMAKNYIENGKDNDAYYILKELNGFADSEVLLEDFVVKYRNVTRKEKIRDVDYKCVYAYDENGNMILDESYDGNNTLIWKHVFAYDENGNQILHESYDDNKLNYKYVYAYDENGNMILDEMYDENSKLEYKSVYAYDENGNMILSEWYSKNNKLLYKTVYGYDKNGNMILSERYGETGKLESHSYYKYEYQYDNNGNLISGKGYNDDGKLIREIEYYSDGTEKTVKYHLISSYYEYNEKGNITLYEGENYKDKYEYDDMGMLISCEEYRNDTLVLREEYDKGWLVSSKHYNDNGVLKFDYTYENSDPVYFYQPEEE